MEGYNINLDEACKKFRKILEGQLVRIENMKAQGDFTDYSAIDKIRIGVCGGDGIGPIITSEAARVLKYILADLVECGKVEFVDIEGLTIENRIAKGKAIPDDVMEALKSCDIILKGLWQRMFWDSRAAITRGFMVWNIIITRSYPAKTVTTSMQKMRTVDR